MSTTLPFDKDALEWFAWRTDPSRALDQKWMPPNWAGGRGALDALFAVDRLSHFLRHHRGLLPQLWERQITQALQAMLLSQPDRTLERCQALLRALMRDEPCALSAVDRVTADEADRMDLAIHCRRDDGSRFCIVIEAKLESELSGNQLAKYRSGLMKNYPDASQRCLWVVAPTRTAGTRAVMGRRVNREWRFSTWRRLLVEWQRALPEDTGTDALSLFAEIWKRVGGS